MQDKDELTALRGSIREVLNAESALDVVVRHVNEGGSLNASLWRTAASLGWQGLGVPEAHGGLGLGEDALAVVYEELGRSVAPVPLLPTLLTAWYMALLLPEPLQARWLPRIAAGEAKAALSLPAMFEPAIPVLARDGATITLSGECRSLLDGGEADLLFILAHLPEGGFCRVVVEPKADGITVKNEALWDHTHGFASIRFAGQVLPAERMTPVTGMQEQQLASHAALALVADSIGGSERILEATVEYLKIREQFGKPIGSFQALKHRAADHQTLLMADRALFIDLVTLACAASPDLALEASAAKAQICGNYVALTRDAIQLHGGIGFTAEHAAHLFLKRARLNEALFGSSAWHLGQVQAHLLGDGAP